MPSPTFTASSVRDVRSDRVDDEEAPPAGAVEAEEPAQHRVVDVDDALVAVLEQRRAVRAEVDGDAARQQPVALHPDAEPGARRAAVAVGGDHVPRAHGALVVGVELAQRDGDAVLVLLEPDRVDPVAQLRAELERPFAQQGLERVLVEEQAVRGAEALDPLVDVGDVDRELAAGERLDRVDPAARVVGAQRRLACRVLEPDLAQDLHRAQLEVPGAGVDRGTRVALYGERPHAVMAEEHRGGQPDEAAADDRGHRSLRPP